MSSNSMITVVSPYKLVAYGLARELSLRFQHSGGNISFCYETSQCEPSDVFILYFSCDTQRLLTQLKSLRSHFPAAKIVILLDEIAFELIASLAAVGINALLSRHDGMPQLEKKLRLLLSQQIDHCPLYIPNTKAATKHVAAIPSGLTKRDISILALASYGLSDSEIAQAVETGIGAIKNRLSNIYDKMGVTNRLEALALLQKIQINRLNTS